MKSASSIKSTKVATSVAKPSKQEAKAGKKLIKKSTPTAEASPEEAHKKKLKKVKAAETTSTKVAKVATKAVKEKKESSKKEPRGVKYNYLEGQRDPLSKKKFRHEARTKQKRFDKELNAIKNKQSKEYLVLEKELKAFKKEYYC